MSNIRLLTVVIALVYASMGVSSPLMTLYLEELGASYGRISLILASWAIVSLTGNYLWGRLTDRLGRRKPLLVFGLGGLALAYFLLSRAPDYRWAWGYRVLEGAAMSAYLTPSLALMGDLLAAGGRRGRRMGNYRAVASLTFAVAAVIGGRLADATSTATALTFSAAGYGVAGVIALGIDEPPVSVEERSLGYDGASPGERIPNLFIAGVVLWMAAHVATASMWPNFMASLGYTKSTISGLWGWAALIEVPSMRYAGILSDVMGRAPLLAVGGVGWAVICLGYVILARWLPGLALVQSVRGVAFGSYTAVAMVFAAEWGPTERRGHDTGLYNASAGAGQIIGVLSGGALAQLLGFGWLFTICAGLAVLSAFCFWRLRIAAPQPIPVDRR